MGGPHLVSSVAPVLPQIFMSQNSILSIKQEVQELHAVHGAYGTGGGSHLGKDGTGMRSHSLSPPHLPPAYPHPPRPVQFKFNFHSISRPGFHLQISAEGLTQSSQGKMRAGCF